MKTTPQVTPQVPQYDTLQFIAPKQKRKLIEK